MQTLLHNIRWPIPAEILLRKVPIPIKSTKGTSAVRVLGMVWRRVKRRIRFDEYDKRNGVCASYGLLGICRGNTSRKVCVPHLRQPEVHKSIASICRDARRQHGGLCGERSFCMAREEVVSKASCKNVGVSQTYECRAQGKITRLWREHWAQKYRSYETKKTRFVGDLESKTGCTEERKVRSDKYKGLMT